MGAKTGGALAGAGKGAMKGAAIGSVVPGIGTAVGGVAGGVIGGVKGWFGAKAKEEQNEATREAEIAQAKLNFDVSEDSRLAHAGLGGGVDFAGLGLQGIDPAIAEQLGVRRNYDKQIEAGAVDRNAGAGSAYIEGLGDAVFDYGTQYAGNELTGGIAVSKGVGPGLDPGEELA